MTTNREWLYSLDVADLSDWLDAEHVDANDDLAPESDVRADAVDANDENATCNNSGDFVTDDSREKLEADVYRAADEMEEFTYGERFINTNKILRWLDRQAAITRKSEQAAWIQQANGLIHEANVRADELQDTVESLKAERDYWRTWYLNIEHDNSVLQAKVDELRDELAKRDKGIARLKRQRDEARRELEKRRWEYCETCEHAEHVDRLEAECDKLKRKEKQLGNELGLRDKAIEMLQDVKQELIAERDNLAADLQDCEQQRERLRQALGMAIDHAHEVVSLVNLDGEVIG